MTASPWTAGARPRVLVLADTDSRWKWGFLTALQLFPTGAHRGLLLNSSRVPSHRQLADTGVAAQPDLVDGVPDFVELPELSQVDVIVLALPGGAVQAVLHGLARRWQQPARRPLVVSGYVGVVYEKHAEGLLLRSGSDVILANSPADADAFRRMLAGAGADPAVVLETVLPFLGDPGSVRGHDGPFTVTFAAQPGVPGARADRELVLRRLVRHARLYPEREVLLKVRGMLGERTTHVERYPYQQLAARLGVERPPNLTIVHGNMGEVLERTDLLVTVSSTAAVEAMHRGIPTAILTDFGLKERLGNHYFIGSGCLAGFTELDNGALPVADPVWASSRGLGPSTAVERARAAVAARVAEQARPPLRPFYTMENASGMLPQLLGRYDLDGHGHALEADDAALLALHGAVRSLVSRAARTAYRQGVETVAPALRRLARL
ncbi:DUF6716 putative glycosyltransferase [Micropruina sp.]|uniref:DUF6716 putative glycosyltransferase n=1 Tax=Micropruina sp. TaxID=2737536 RepID=UPI0039E432AA